MSAPEDILSRYSKLTAEDANEAATRLKVINDVLFQVLGWTHDDIHPEERVSEDGKTMWADYVLRTAMTSVVVEAKKVGLAFSEVPETRRANLRGKLISGSTGEAIIQARDYARKLSIPFAVATNGNAWIIFPATRVDGVKFSDSSAVIFPNLASALSDNYAEFYDLLSREAVVNNSLERELLGRVENQVDDFRLNRYFPTNFSRISRHSLFPLIEDAVTTAFSEDIVNSHPELLEKCYVKTPERVRFDSRVRVHISKRDLVTQTSPARPMRERSNPLISVVKGAADRAKPAALLVLGQVGAGKTTFLTYTRNVGAADLFAKSAEKPYPHWLEIDFRSFARDGSVLDFIFSDLRRQINADGFLGNYDRCIKHAYKIEIEELFQGPLALVKNDEKESRKKITDLLMADYNKMQPYVEKILSYASKSSPVFIVVDNMDQFEDESIQGGIFSNSMAIAQKLRVNLLISMRESTYLRHKSSPIFDAFDFDPIAIDPPDVLAVLSKRFFLTHQLLKGQKGQFTAENGAHVDVSDLSKIVDLVQTSVLGSSIGNLIAVMASSDIRLALRMTREFLRSGWTASGKAYRIYMETGKYYLPPHEALRAIMLGSQQVYSEETSEIGNPFDARLAKTEAQLLRLYILAAIVTLSSERSFRYLEGSEVKKMLHEIGFGDKICLKVLTDLCALRFIHTTSHSAPSLESNFIVSRLGAYIVRHFLCDIMFLENVMMDTFISEQKTWNLLKALTTEIHASHNTIARLKIRKARVSAFFDHMSRKYTALRDESIRRGLPREWCTHPLEMAAVQLEENLGRALSSAQRYYGDASD